jgi:alkylated DNA repair dioxygenase AlkB
VNADMSRLRRHVLGDGAWIDHQAGWLEGHEAVFHAVRASADWQHERRLMFDRHVDVPRLTASLSLAEPGHPVLGRAVEMLSGVYETCFDRLHAAFYRDGRDSVAWHGDRVLGGPRGTLVAILSLGEPRTFLIKPAAGGRSLSFRLGWGDLLVLGGTIQRTWQHSVPKAASAGPRISLMFRRSQDGLRSSVGDPESEGP